MRALTVFTYLYTVRSYIYVCVWVGKRECVCSTSKSPRSASIIRIYFINGKNIHLPWTCSCCCCWSLFFHSHKIFDELFSFSVWTTKLIDFFFSEKKRPQSFLFSPNWWLNPTDYWNWNTQHLAVHSTNRFSFFFNFLQYWCHSCYLSDWYAISCIISSHLSRIWIFFWILQLPKLLFL